MKYFEVLNNKIKCTVCPRECLLAEGQKGFCRVRQNKNGKIDLIPNNYATGLAVDPVEKKPLYHFYPSTSVLSFGTFGCNMGCKFCQNYHLSKFEQNFDYSVKATPEMIVATAKKYNCKSVAFTYNDPVVFIEYAIETAKLCRQEGIKTVAVSAGYMNLHAAKDLYSYIDAANIDLKGFSEDFYAKNCLAKLEPVLNTIKYVSRETDCIVELTTLLIDGENTSDEILKNEFDWIINELGDEIPLHLSAFHPAWKFSDRSNTKTETLFSAYSLAKETGLKYVYTGNIADAATSATVCPVCKRELIKRYGFNSEITGLKDGKCINCGHKIYGKFD